MGPSSVSNVAIRWNFIVQNAGSFAGKKAEEHFNKTIELAKEIGAKGLLGGTYLDLGLLYKTKKRVDQARQCISKAIQIFEEGEAKVYPKVA